VQKTINKTESSAPARMAPAENRVNVGNRGTLSVTPPAATVIDAGNSGWFNVPGGAQL